MKIADLDFYTVDEARYFIRNLLAKYPVGSPVTEEQDRKILQALLEKHPELGAKIPAGSIEFTVVRNRKKKSTEIKIQNPDGASIQIPWIECLM